jgi:hypothetical protein
MKLISKIKILFIVIIFTISCNNSDDLIFLEAESFPEPGGWVVDQQAMDIMGSPYMLAHGLGIPVEDAETVINLKSAKNYQVWVRTRDWAATWKANGSPGKFKLLINGVPLDTTFGTKGAEWFWQNGGTVRLNKGSNKISLHDLTGFNGRCDAVIFSANKLIFLLKKILKYKN